MTIGNPNHPVTRKMEGNWHKVAALLMQNQGLIEFNITEEMTQGLKEAHRNIIVADTRAGGLVIRLVSESEGRAFMKEEGLKN